LIFWVLSEVLGKLLPSSILSDVFDATDFSLIPQVEEKLGQEILHFLSRLQKVIETFHSNLVL